MATDSLVKATKLLDASGVNQASISAGGAVKVDGSAVTQPVSGTVAVSTINSVAPAFGSGVRGATVQRVTVATDDVVPVTDNSGSLTVDAPVGTPVFVRLSDGASAISTLPVSLASVPSHAVTNAGTFAVQDSQVIADNAGFTDGTSKVFPAGFIYDEVAGTALTENDAAAARINANRAMVNCIEDGSTRARYATVTASNALKVDGSAVTQPVSGTVSIASNSSVNVAQINGVTTTMGNGVSGTGVQRVTIASDSTGVVGLNTGTNSIGKISDITTSIVPGTGATNLGKAEDAAHTTGDTGVLALGRRIDTAAASSGTSGDYECLNMSAEGATWSTLTPTTNSGLSVANFNSGDTYTALTNTAQVIKSSAGNLYGYYIYNPNTSVSYVMIYNVAAASVTVGTTTAQMVFAIPASSGANLMFPYPITFSNAGWSIAAATTGGGNTAPTTALEVMIWYK